MTDKPSGFRSVLRRTFGGGGRRRLVAVLLLAMVAVVLGVVLSTRSSSSNQTSGVPLTGTATVHRRDLVETDTQSGTISYANPQMVYDRLGGTITRLPRVGQLVRPGHALYEVDEQPVVQLNGSTPAHRELSSGDSDGQDLLQLNRNLVTLGFDPDGVVVDDVWQPATTAGVEVLQASLGLAETGRLPLGQVVFLPGDQIVSAVNASVGSTDDDGTGEPGSSPASGSTESSPSASTGGGSATPILQTTSTQLIVTVDLPASSQSEAKRGEAVTVEMPAGNVADGMITAVSPIAAAGSGSSSSSSTQGSPSGSSATVPVTIKLRGRVSGAGLDQAPVSVNFAQAVAKDVLSVPVTALLATLGGAYAVQEVQPPHQLIPVTTGLFAAGYVQISGPRIHEGLRVTNSQG